MSEVRFNLTPVQEKPSRRYMKESKYDPILDPFMKGEEDLVEVNVSGKDANYLRTQLQEDRSQGTGRDKGLSSQQRLLSGESVVIISPIFLVFICYFKLL